MTARVAAACTVVLTAACLWPACAARPDGSARFGDAVRSAGAPRGPNIVVVMTDDQGYGDLGCHGNPLLDTPHLDALAAQSVRVDPFYVHPVCTPTRAALMTGRYPYRTRAFDTFVGRAMLEPDETTIAEILRDAGWATGIFGKWHLGDCYPMRPNDQGFEEALVHKGGGIGQPSDPPGGERRYTDPVLFHNGVAAATEGYCTDVYFDAAIAWMRRCNEAGRPFFAYVPTNCPHGPFHDVPREPYEKYRARDLRNDRFPQDRGHPLPERSGADHRARIFAMIENIDQNVGRLCDALDELGIAEDTIVVYLHDNGPNERRYNCGFRGNKSSVYEGGIRSPLFVRWPRRLSPAHRSGRWAAHIDLLPTLLAACGVPRPKGLRLDGRSILPLLDGSAGASAESDGDSDAGADTGADADADGAATDWPDRILIVQTHRGDAGVPEHHVAVRTDRWKLVRHSGFGREMPPADAPFELFDMRTDPLEERDVAAEHPEVIAELRSRYRAWFLDVANTRADNWAPPRIVIGADAEPVTVLTRQDWRVVERGRGWGAPDMIGRWHVDVARPGRYELRCTLRGVDDATRAVLEVAGQRHEVPVTPGADACAFEGVELPAGPTSVVVRLRAADRAYGAWQVSVRRS